MHRVGLAVQDYPGVILEPRITRGDWVRRGEVLCVDRHRPQIAFVASIPGRVSQIRQGARRRVETIELAADGDDRIAFDVDAAAQTDAALRSLLLESGAWCGFRTRPFGRLPDPEDMPSAIFVTATASHPLAPDPRHALAPQIENFMRGVATMLRLTDGPVFLCQPPGAALVEPRDRLRVVRFSGPPPSGLPGTHIHHLWPVSGQRVVWQIGYQDVAAIGALLGAGQFETMRTVSVAGAETEMPALVRAPLGAELTALLGSLPAGPNAPPRLVSGTVLTGKEAQYLGRYDLSMTVLAPPREPRSALSRILGLLPSANRGATLPSEAFERLFPFDLLPVPLMRALAVGDIETMERLGGLELLEEDLALLTCRCPSGSDYGKLLRKALETHYRERVA